MYSPESKGCTGPSYQVAHLSVWQPLFKTIKLNQMHSQVVHTHVQKYGQVTVITLFVSLQQCESNEPRSLQQGAVTILPDILEVCAALRFDLQAVSDPGHTEAEQERPVDNSLITTEQNYNLP